MSPLIVAALVLSAPAPAEAFGAARAKVLAPYLDEQTVPLGRLRKRKAADRPALAKAFAAAGEGAVQAVFLPPPQLVKLIDEHAPSFPKELGGASTKPFTEGVQWAALGLDAPPKLTLRLT